MKIETKLTKQQYAALLDRTMNRKPVTEQSSPLMDMQGAMDQAMPQENMFDPGIQAPQMDPMAGMAMQGAMAPPQLEDPMGGMPQGPQGMGQAVQTAEQSLRSIKGTIGEQLWNRLAKSSPDTVGQNPDSAFVASVVKFMRDPNSLKDPNVRQFIQGIVGQAPQMSSFNDAMPNLMASMSLGQQGGM